MVAAGDESIPWDHAFGRRRKQFITRRSREMLYRKVPKNGDQLSVLGYGCMRFPVRMKSINEALAQKQILRSRIKRPN